MKKLILCLCLMATPALADATVDCGLVSYKVPENSEPTLVEAKLCLYLRDLQDNSDLANNPWFEEALQCENSQSDLRKEVRNLRKRLKIKR